MKELPELFFTTRDQIDPKVIEIYNIPQFEQRTPEWFDQREKCISASDIASALYQTDKAVSYYIESFGHLDSFDYVRKPKSSCNTYSSREELILKKCGLSEFSGNAFTQHGVKFEKIATNIYSQLRQIDILEFGLLIHPEHSFIGASPDAITTDKRAVEIKCPVQRKVKNHPSLHYFLQVLIQLLSTGLEYCDFMDAHFIDYLSFESWKNDADLFEIENPDLKYHTFGIVMKKNEEFIYPPTSCVKVNDFIEWKNSNFEEGMEVTFYKCHEFYISEIKVSQKWLLDNLQDIKETWDEILFGRTEEGQKLLKSKIDEKEKKKEERRQKKSKVNEKSLVNELYYIVPLI